MGGPGGERAVSLKSGRAVADALQRRGHAVLSYDVTGRALPGLAELQPDVAFLALHGAFGEDGTVQGLLEVLGVPYVGSGVLASSVAMDKAMAKTLTAAAGLPQARYRAVREREITPSTAELLAGDLGLPCFVKPANMGSSVGVSKAHDLDELQAAIDLALGYDEWIVVEEAITGREIELAVIGNDDPFVSVPGEIIPGDEFYSYDDKYVNDMSSGVIPADLTPAQASEVQGLALAVYRTLRVEGLARCDFFLEERRADGAPGRGFLVNEVNTMPGFTPISTAGRTVRAWDGCPIRTTRPTHSSVRSPSCSCPLVRRCSGRPMPTSRARSR